MRNIVAYANINPLRYFVDFDRRNKKSGPISG